MTLVTPIYMDHQATTPVDPEVLGAMLPYFADVFGNAASKSHSFGWRAEAAVEAAREQLAACLNADASEIFFTSGATESNNLALFGAARALRPQGRHLISCATEHKAILDPLAQLSEEGFAVTYLPVDREGHIDLNQLKSSIQKDTILISLMAANNEVGTIHPLKEIGKIAGDAGVLFHSDAAQAAGKIPLDVREQNIDLLSLSAHKIYGPKGIGALYVRKKKPTIHLEPIIYGGGHEKGLRSGTLNVPAIVGMGAALEKARKIMAKESSQLNQLRRKLWDTLKSQIEDIQLNGPEDPRLPGNLNITFTDVPSERLMMELKDVAVSSGSACTTADPKPSHVLTAMGLDDPAVRSSIRFGLGRFSTAEQVDYVARRVTELVTKIRGKSIE
jgi:cysteine desulfurase